MPKNANRRLKKMIVKNQKDNRIKGMRVHTHDLIKAEYNA